MRKAIAIGMLGVALFSNRAAAQTAVERAAILRDFQRSVVDYTQQHDECLAMFPEAVTAATPAPKIFTLPVAMVFRQIIAGAIADDESASISAGISHSTAHPAPLRPFPAGELVEFPRILSDALPLLPPSLEYRLIGNDLVIRDAERDIIVAVLRGALGASGTKQ